MDGFYYFYRSGADAGSCKFLKKDLTFPTLSVMKVSPLSRAVTSKRGACPDSPIFIFFCPVEDPFHEI